LAKLFAFSNFIMPLECFYGHYFIEWVFYFLVLKELYFNYTKMEH
jgi:hypothetical protein